MRGQVLGRRRARRLSRCFATVGVKTSPERLQEMLAGMPATDDEMTDVHFALIATRINHEARLSKFKRMQRRSTRSLMFAGLVLVVLNFLVCVAYVLFSLSQQATLL
jgi:hypothetical protein